MHSANVCLRRPKEASVFAVVVSEYGINGLVDLHDDFKHLHVPFASFASSRLRLARNTVQQDAQHFVDHELANRWSAALRQNV